MHDNPQQPARPPSGAVPDDPGGSSPQAPPDQPAGGDAQAEISRHIAEIVAALEREAGARREAARAEADLLLVDARARADALLFERQARIAALSDELLRKSEAIAARLGDADPARRGFEHLVGALADTAERVAQLGGAPGPGAASGAPAAPPGAAPGGQQPGRAQASSTPAPAEAGRPGPPAPEPPTGRDPDEGLRIVASEMAGAGASRASVRAYLRGALGVGDPERFLDEAFGRAAS